MKKLLNYLVLCSLFVTLVVISGCSSNKTTDNNTDFQVMDREKVSATKADYTLANKMVAENKVHTKKEDCFQCHDTVSQLHTRGAHKDVDCAFCHDIDPKHLEEPSAENRPSVHMEWQSCGQCHDNQMHSFLEVGEHRPARFEKSNSNGRSPNPAWEKLMSPYGFTKEHAATRSHSVMLIDQFVVDRAFGGQFQPKAGWNYIFQSGPAWDILEDKADDNGTFKDLPQTTRAVNPVCMNCKTMDHMLGWAY